MSVFKIQGLKYVSFLPQFIPALTQVARHSSAPYQEFYLEQLAVLIDIAKQHVRHYTGDILDLLQSLWDNERLQPPIAAIIEALGTALNNEIRPFLSTLIPLSLKVFDGELTDKTIDTQLKLLNAFQSFGAGMEDYLHVVIPAIVLCCESTHSSAALRRRAIRIIQALSEKVDLSDYASRIFHPLVRILDTSDLGFQVASLDALCSLAIQLDSDFLIFVPIVNKVVSRHRIIHHLYENVCSKLVNGERLHREITFNSDSKRQTDVPTAAKSVQFTVNQQHLKQAWDISDVATKDDWTAWMHQLGLELIRESPSATIRTCTSLAEVYAPLVKELFNAAFISCWVELYDQYQDSLIQTIETAFSARAISSDIIHQWLNLVEFMEREGTPLPIEQHILSEYAYKYLAYAKALRYKELEYWSGSSSSTIESLITINTRLQQHDSVQGILRMTREHYDINANEEWYERLGRWQEALQIYERKIESGQDTPSTKMGRIKCLHALGQWGQLASDIEVSWSEANGQRRREISPIAAAAAWSLKEWGAMEDYVRNMQPDSPDCFFYRAILYVHRSEFSKAKVHIAKARDFLYPELTSFLDGGHGSHNILVRMQMLSELEEVIVYKQSNGWPGRQATMRRTWVKRLSMGGRLQGCQRDVEVWQRILQVRTLALESEDAPQMWLKFANLCRKSDRMNLAENVLKTLLAKNHTRYSVPQFETTPEIVYAHLKNRLFNDITALNDQRASTMEQRRHQLTMMLARCHLKSGEWQAQLDSDWISKSTLVGNILNHYVHATRYDPKWYKAWHTWALANAEVANLLNDQRNSECNRGISNAIVAEHVVHAIEGLFQCISLCNRSVFQDTLRLLTLWFRFGSNEIVSNVIIQGFAKVSVDNWLEVIPQIIARIQTRTPPIKQAIHNILVDIGKHHPQALIYPLIVASKSPSQSRADVASDILNVTRVHSSKIVQQVIPSSHSGLAIIDNKKPRH
ncbi:FAT domain-containing protein [Lentinula edodes]|nr:FAT domain-containing protein [Lentinula edodes]